jgi:DNA-binding MarR family transcriptional regulator
MARSTAPAHARLSPQQLATWRQFLRVHAQLVRRLEADLVTQHDLPLAWYDVLVQLAEAGTHRLRMTELAQAVLISRSGLTRLVDRMVAARLIRREPAPDDARGAFAVLTEEGYDALKAASRTHLRGVREYAVGSFDPEELVALSGMLARMEQASSDPETHDAAITRRITQGMKHGLKQVEADLSPAPAPTRAPSGTPARPRLAEQRPRQDAEGAAEQVLDG